MKVVFAGAGRLANESVGRPEQAPPSVPHSARGAVPDIFGFIESSAGGSAARRLAADLARLRRGAVTSETRAALPRLFIWISRRSRSFQNSPSPCPRASDRAGV